MRQSTEQKAESRNKVLSFIKASSILLSAFCSLLCLTAQADTFDYQVVLQGGRYVVQGGNLHVFISLSLLSGSSLAGVIPLSFSGLPAGVTYRMPNIDSNGSCCGNYPNYGLYGIGGGSGDWLQLTVAPTTAPGDYVITVQATAPTIPPLVRTATMTMTVLTPAAIAITPAPLLPAVPIPHLADWENAMLSYGSILCNQNNISQYEQGVWYYDGERVFYQIGDYRNETSWQTTCAQWVENAYLPSILARNGGEQGYEVFTRGLRIDAERTGNTVSKKALHLLANADYYYEYTREAIWPGAMRENSYALEAMLDDEAANGAAYSFDTTTMEALLGQLDQIFIQKQYNTYMQPFMMGLMANALIQYYTEKSPDPRIPYYLKQALDGMWNEAWSDTEHGFNYQCWPVEETDNLGNTTFCYNAGDADYQGPAMPPPGPYAHDVLPNLNLLIAPAYAWMYLQTGDNKYRERADTLFADGVVYSDLSGAGKTFSQNYRWSFDYVKWRQQANAQAGPIPPGSAPPTISVSSPTAGSVLSGPAMFMAMASGSVNITAVQFQLDGINAGVAVAGRPFEATLNTALFANGSHSLTAIAYDEAGHQTTSAPVTVTITNSANASYAACDAMGAIPTGSFKGCYYFHANDANVFTDPYNNSNFGVLVTTRTDAAINFHWGTGSPVPGVSPSGSYAVVWQGDFALSSGTYKFQAAAGYGMRFYVDNQQILPAGAWFYEWWSTNPPPDSYDLTFATAGTHRIRAEFFVCYPTVSSGYVQLSWAPDAAPPALRPPLVEWFVPYQGTGYATGTNIPLIVKVFGMDGATIQRVDFYNGATPLGSATSAAGNNQYTITWADAPRGNTQIAATCTDSNGAVTSVLSNPINVQDPPTVSWAAGAPADGLVIAEGSTLTFPVLASAAGAATIASVNIVNNGSVYASSATADGPGHYSPSIPNASYDNYLYAGNYAFTAQAMDSNGVPAQTSAIHVTVQSSSPTVTWISPLTETGFLPGSTITMTATASGTLGATIQSVQFLEPGVGWMPAIFANGQYTFTWNNVPAGTYQLNILVTDSNGRQTSLGSNIEIDVHNSPSVSWVSPAAGSTFGKGATVPLTAQAASAGTAVILQVDFLNANNNNALLGSASNWAAGGQFTLNWPNVSSGNYAILARATDSNGLQSAFSSPITLTINGGAQSPFVETNPLNVKIYPNPWRSDKHAAFGMTFDGLTVGTTIKIFTVSGHEAKELHTDGPKVVWDLTNDSGDKVASGIYLYVITDSQGDKVRGKVAVIK